MAEPQDCAAFLEAIDEAAAAAGDVSVADDLFGSPRFIAVYENPAPHARCALALIATPAAPRERRLIAALSMQRLEPRHYVVLAERAQALHARGEIGFRELLDVVMPGVAWAKAMQHPASEPRVAAVMRYLLTLDALDPARRRFLEQRLEDAP